MGDDQNNNGNNWVRPLLKALLIVVVIFVALVAVGFGLLVGFCGLGR